MKVNLTRIILFAFAAILPQAHFAQTQPDSTNGQSVETYYRRLSSIQTQQTVDSLKITELELQLQRLDPTNKEQEAIILKQIGERKETMANRTIYKLETVASLRKNITAAPVTGFFGDTLFMIYNKLGSFSVAERANAISARIQNVSRDAIFDNHSIVLIDEENSTDVVYGETTLMSVTEKDALLHNTTTHALAQQYSNTITDAITRFQSEISFATLTKESITSLLLVALLGVFIYLVTRVFRYTASRIQKEEHKSIKGIRFKDYTLFDTGRELKLILAINTIIKWMLIIILVYLTLPLLFGIFPWTRNLADTLFGYILTPLKKFLGAMWRYMPNLFTILVIIVLFRYLIRALRFFKTEIATGQLKINGFYPDWANPTYQIIRTLLYAFMFVLIFPYLPGSDSPIFKGVSVFLGFLFTFGSAGSLSNIIAGLVLTYMRLFVIGDRVKIGDITGDVIEKSLLVTRIRTIKNEIISIPNSTVMSSHTINYSSATGDKALILHTTVTIGYDTPWRNIHQALLNAAARTEGLLTEPAPFVFQTALSDFYVAYQLNAYTLNANQQVDIYSFLHQNIQDCCNEAGIEIMSPHYFSARDGNKTTIPANYLPADYAPPSFNVKSTPNE